MTEQTLSVSRSHPILATTEEIVDEARNGRMFILVDDEDRENEGDLVIPAQMVTPAAITFMARHRKRLICLALSKPRVDQLGLTLMSTRNETRHETAFTVSIEARTGVTTGISAADRAHTVAVAIDASKGPEEIVTPGHVFPLIARPGGVLVRAGHTEAAVDVSRLAGLNPSGVICEIMKDDGTMARMDDLVAFAQLHGLKIGTIRDLIAFRRRHDHNVEKVTTASFESRWGGDWQAITYRNKAVGAETLVLVKGKLDLSRPTLVRMHALNIFADTLGEIGARKALLASAMQAIANEGSGVVVVLNRGMQLSEIVRSRAEIAVPEMEALRDYGIGAQILAELGIHEMVLLTNSHRTLVALDGYGLNIVEERRL
ncbi:3,4-dihydroxy-2-butanone-4-phosphate synthase [Sphingomonas tabacisoli]|uniref:3,4-dihydroxy-2-butanone 4-phosphate synthase n=1 Tax=Sphingomonas tabacisoli TaxID=2249466 RepID=A0ABW4I2G0_9SPHN